MKLTPANISRLACPPGHKDKLYFDETQQGLAVRVTGSGSKSFLCHYTVHGRKRRIPLGSCNSITLAQARELTRGYMAQVALGNDPFLARKTKRDALTLDELISSWQTLHLATKRPKYGYEAVRALRYAFRANLDLPVGYLSRKAVIEVLDAMVRQKSASTALLVAYGKAFFNWAIKRDVLTTNPFVNLTVAPTRKRARVLTDDELAAIWRATEGAGPFNGMVRILLLTGQRRGEVAGMTWTELSEDFATWTIPDTRTKNHRAHVVPLSQPAQGLLRAFPQYSELIFPGLHGPFRNWWAAKINLDKRSGVSSWVLHDIRRTVATGLQRLGVRLEVTEAALNHVSGSRGGIVGIYQRHDFATEKRAGLEAWGKYVLAIVEGRLTSDNVVALRERA